MFDLTLYIPVKKKNHSRHDGFPGLTSTGEYKLSCSRKQCSASGEALTHNPSISSQALSNSAPDSPLFL